MHGHPANGPVERFATRRTAWSRRTFLASGAAFATPWLTPVAEVLARTAPPQGGPAKSVIVLWLAGGPSQLETFDPHPGTKIAGETAAIDTRLPGVQFARGYEQLAEQADKLAIVRAVVSKEGDHERATYNMKTGFRPDPTLVHPSIGAVLCHQLPDNVEIPRHISILPGQWPGRGGYLGDEFDAFQIGDPQDPIPDVLRPIPGPRFDRRVDDLFDVVEREFARGRLPKLDERKTLHGLATRAALRMMSSEQLKAFEIQDEPAELKAAFGDTPFGRGCLAAIRLIGVGVRCVEVTLDGWDSHINNHEIHARQARTLDPAFATLLAELERRELLDQTLVVCCGEFGRTPNINPTGGRDHWPHGFSVVLAGGGLRRGVVVGETSPATPAEAKNWDEHLKDSRPIADVHATILQALGINFKIQLPTPIGRPMVIGEGKVLEALLSV